MRPPKPTRRSAKISANLQAMPPYLFRWKTRPDIAQLEQTVDQLRTELIRTRRQLTGKQQYIDRLKFLVQQRSTTIDDQRGKLEQSQAQIRQLDEEADHLAELVRQS